MHRRGRDAYKCTQIAHVGFADLLPHQKGGAFRGELFGRGHAHQRGLARAIGANNDPALIELYLPVHGSDEGLAATAQLDAAKIYEPILISGSYVVHAFHCD